MNALELFFGFLIFSVRLPGCGRWSSRVEFLSACLDLGVHRCMIEKFGVRGVCCLVAATSARVLLLACGFGFKSGSTSAWILYRFP